MYLAVEWTSAAFHAWRIADSGAVLDERKSATGVNTIKDGAFEVALRRELGDWLNDADRVLLSGMITSRNGWVETPYAPTPANAGNIADRAVQRRIDGLPPLVFLPGIAQSNPVPDMIRGEELAVLGAAIREGIVLVPGAHSKWIALQGGAISGITTYLTGELIRLLLHDSIVARLVPSETEDDLPSFDEGVMASQRAGAALFSARSRVLFNTLSPARIPSYLNGVLIGAELREGLSAASPSTRLYVLGHGELVARYERCAELLGRLAEPLAVNAAAGFHRVSRCLQNLPVQL